MAGLVGSRSSAVLLAACGVLAGMIGLELAVGAITPPADETRAAAKPERAKPDASPAFTMAPIAKFGAFIERPPFAKSRRPPETKPQTPPVRVSPAASEITLIGVILSAKRRVALLKRASGTEVKETVEGDVIWGWTVRKIFRDHMTLSDGTTETDIYLRDQKSPAIFSNEPQPAAEESPTAVEPAPAPPVNPGAPPINPVAPTGVGGPLRPTE